MTRRLSWWFTAAMISIPVLLLSSSATAQDEFEVWTPGEDNLWTNDDNWVFDGELSAAPFDRRRTGSPAEWRDPDN